jgi:hypothetical protein
VKGSCREHAGSESRDYNPLLRIASSFSSAGVLLRWNVSLAESTLEAMRTQGGLVLFLTSPFET